MIHDVETIDAQLKAFGFRDPETLTQVCVEAPGSRPFDGLPAYCPAMTWQRILQNDLFTVGNRLKRAELLQREGHSSALRIGNVSKASALEVIANELIVCTRIIPAHRSLAQIERPDDIGHAIGI